MTNMMIDDVVDGRGPWMTTSLGGQFFPGDPRPEEVFIEDIANGLAQNGRYNGQRVIGKHYSVAEHSWHMARYGYYHLLWPPEACLIALLHDAPEAYVNDLNRATKQVMRGVAAQRYGGPERSDYDVVSDRIERVIWQRFGLSGVEQVWRTRVKGLDRRIVANEKAVVVASPDQPWAFDQFEPLEGVAIRCWEPTMAKESFLGLFNTLCFLAGGNSDQYYGGE